MEQSALRSQFQQAIDRFVDKLKEDINVIAVIVGGSVAYDVIWEKSDVDVTIVVRDQILKGRSLSLTEDGITFNTYLMSRSQFKRGLEGMVGGSFIQSYFANGKMVYSTDESLNTYFEELRQIGEDDRAMTGLHLAAELVGTMQKVQKWMLARKDLAYAQYFMLKAAELIAGMELCERGIPRSRNAIQKALDFNPQMMQVFYHTPMQRPLTEADLTAGVELLDAYLTEKMEIFKRPVLEYLADGEVKTTSMIAERFHTDSHYIVEALDFLAEKGVIERVSKLIKLTPKSRFGVEEIGFLYVQ
jgi:hypothetical protein